MRAFPGVAATTGAHGRIRTGSSTDSNVRPISCSRCLPQALARTADQRVLDESKPYRIMKVRACMVKLGRAKWSAQVRPRPAPIEQCGKYLHNRRGVACGANEGGRRRAGGMRRPVLNLRKVHRMSDAAGYATYVGWR
jgi:hypothetical protein